MPLTQSDLDSFHAFASEKLRNGGGAMSLEEIVAAWRAERELQEANAGIRRGLSEVESGQHRPLDDFMDEFRRQHNISPEA